MPGSAKKSIRKYRGDKAMNAEILLIRHGLDDDGITNPIDGLDGIEPDLTAEGMIGTSETAMGIVDNLKYSTPEAGVHIYSGTKLRTTHTAQIIHSFLTEASIESTLSYHSAFDNLIYGNLRPGAVDHEQNVERFRLAWRAFDESWYFSHNIDYRFGSPVPDDVKYGALSDFIEPPYGESQRDIYIRVYDSLKAILEARKKDGRLPIVVTHKTIAREVQTFIEAQNMGISVDECPLQRPLKHGEIVYTKVQDVDFCIESLAYSIKRMKGGK